MARPKMDPTLRKGEQINLRLTGETLTRAESLIAHLQSMHGSASITRTDVLREALQHGLRQLELERAAARGGGTRSRRAG